MKEKFIVIPESIYCDKDLSKSAGYLFGLIQTLDNSNGCSATNEYLASKINVDPRTITRDLTLLIEKGYVYSEFDRHDKHNRSLHITKNYNCRVLAKNINKNDNAYQKRHNTNFSLQLNIGNIPSVKNDEKRFERSLDKFAESPTAPQLNTGNNSLVSVARQESPIYNNIYINNNINIPIIIYYKDIIFYKNNLVAGIPATCGFELQSSIDDNDGFVITINKQDQDKTKPLLEPIDTSLVQDKNNNIVASLNKRDDSLRDRLKQVLYDVKPLSEPKRVPKHIKDFVDFWINLGLHRSRENSIAFSDGVKLLSKLLNGTMFKNSSDISIRYSERKFTPEEIKLSMKRFSLVALDIDYNPSNIEYKKKLAKTPLSTFIYNSYATNGCKSLFLKYLEESPSKISENLIELIENDDRAITNYLKRLYETKILGSIKPKAYRNIDENHFRNASLRLIKFINDNKNKLLLDTILDKKQEYSLWLYESVVKDIPDDQMTKITPSWFDSDTTFNRRLPAYLNSVGIVKSSENPFSIYNDISYNLYDE